MNYHQEHKLEMQKVNPDRHLKMALSKKPLPSQLLLLNNHQENLKS